MTYQQNISGVGTSAAPAICIEKNIIYLAWKGEGSDQGIYWTLGKDLGSVLPQTKIANVATSDAPAITSFKNTIYMAWKGEGSDGSMYLSKLVSGDVIDTFSFSWSPQVQLQGGTSNSPALIGTSEALYLVWKDESDGIRMFWSKSSDGVKWTPQEQITHNNIAYTSTSTPAVAANGNGHVYLAWKGGSDDEMYWAKCSDSKTWSNQQKIAGGCGTGPALTCDSNGVIWLAWAADNGGTSNAILYSKLANESKNQWSIGVQRYGIGTSNRPALVSGPGGDTGITLSWKGETNDSGIYYGALVLPAVAYNLEMINFQILNTRSGDVFSDATDTDYASFSYSVNGGTPLQLNQSCGSHSNSTIATNLRFNNVSLLDTDIIAIAYHITNSSQGPGVAMGYVNAVTSKLLAAYFDVVNAALADYGIPVTITTPDEEAAFIGAQIGNALIPLIGSALGAVAGWLIESSWDVLFPNCDGPVATAIHSYTGAQLRALLTPTAPNAYMNNENNPGVNSPSGCGSNSNYDVLWMIQMA